MRKLILVTGLMLSVSLSALSQGFIITPEVNYSVNGSSQSFETGVSAGVQAIANQSSISVGLYGRRYLEMDDNYFSGKLSSDIFFFRNLGLDLQTSMVKGEFLDEELTIGDNIICKCSGKVIGKEPDTRGSEERVKLFGSAGLVYKIGGIRFSTVYAFKDYVPHNWTEEEGNPYTESIKIGLRYVFRLTKP